MKIGFIISQVGFMEEMYLALKARLAEHEVVAWPAGGEAPASDLEILLAHGTVSRAMMLSQPKLLLVQTVSAGYEGVDVDAATELGIPVAYAPSEQTGNAISVAEWAVGLMLGASRHLNLSLQTVHDSSVKAPGKHGALFGKTVCIVGFGGIGRLLAERLRPFGMRIHATVGQHPEVPGYVKAFSHENWKAAAADADYVVLCLRASKATEAMIDAAALQGMKRGAVLINIARGSLVDEQALYDAVRDGQIAAAGLDVLREEPAAPGNPLLTLPQVLITPHIAGFTGLTLQGTVDYVADTVQAFTAGRLPRALANAPERPRNLPAESHRPREAAVLR